MRIHKYMFACRYIQMFFCLHSSLKYAIILFSAVYVLKMIYVTPGLSVCRYIYVCMHISILVYTILVGIHVLCRTSKVHYPAFGDLPGRSDVLAVGRAAR